MFSESRHSQHHTTLVIETSEADPLTKRVLNSCGRADIDRISKESQSLWLACETLHLAMNTPFTLSCDGLHRTGSLAPLVEAIREILAESGGRHAFVSALLDSLPKEVLKTENNCSGVLGTLTERSLKQRFDKLDLRRQI
ncbi:unnamed protein product [Protopolystoma xenopodis]|uniref:Uncharacterized protein n=1 Tax=Protopolystoma xenopodis TaxID=117903 RepID=A0A448W9V0_9PLAT|nr:unnamed protein product [Protopolystoma xenopodis]